MKRRHAKEDLESVGALWMTSALAARLRRALMRWHESVRRDVPWRETTDPYRILVAEYMSQQTPLERVRAYYERFLERFPDIWALARAPRQQVLRAWEGLGYYARARFLHDAARQIVREHGGQIPSDPERLRALPGCGPYTAAAIASLAFGHPIPVLDGNVMRLLCRAFGVREDPHRAAVRRQLQALARALLDTGDPRQITQALMDLGALICRPRAPHCSQCCWSFMCRARRLGTPHDFPLRQTKPARPHYEIAVGVIWRDRPGAEGRGETSGSREILIAQRAEHGLLGGLWEFPGGKCRPGESLRRCCAREIREEVGLRVRVGRRIATIRHAYSHFRITLHAFECRVLEGEARALGCRRVRWVRPQHLRRYPFPAANRKLIAAVQQEGFLRNSARA